MRAIRMYKAERHVSSTKALIRVMTKLVMVGRRDITIILLLAVDSSRNLKCGTGDWCFLVLVVQTLQLVIIDLLIHLGNLDSAAN